MNINDFFCSLVNKIPDENPMTLFDDIYKNINPMMMTTALAEARDYIKSVKSKPSDPSADVFLTLGGENLNKSFYTGVIAGMLWLRDYISISAPQVGISDGDISQFIKILDLINIPKVQDIHEETVNGVKITVEPSSVRHYTSILSSVISWANNGTKIISKKPRSNMELVRYLSSAALNTFPSIPFCAYYVGSVKCPDPLNLAEKIGTTIKWTDFMTDENYTINEPKFVVTVSDAPVVSIPGHPLSDTYISEIKDGKARWLGLFIENDEFNKLCVQNGINSMDVKKYIIKYTWKEHQINLGKHDKIAEFINKMKVIKEAFEMKDKLSCIFKMDEEIDNMKEEELYE